MNTKNKLACLLFATLTVIASAADKPQPAITTAVYDFKGDGDTANLGGKVTMLVTADLTTETNLVMLERADLSKVLNEQAFGVSGMVSADAAAKIGQVTGVKVLVAGQIIKTSSDHLVVVANVIGTETGRLFAVKKEGATDNLLGLTSTLSHEIAALISAQATNLVSPAVESRAERIARIVKSIAGTNRPSVSINVNAANMLGQNWGDGVAASELGIILTKAGFTVVDENSEKKPDVQITGSSSAETGLPRGGLLTGRSNVSLKITDRRTGSIIGIDSQEATASDLGVAAASTAAEIKALDAIAERLVPLLAK